MKLFLLFVSTLTQIYAQEEEYISKNLLVKFEVLENVNGNAANFSALVTLTNIGEIEIQKNDWSIFFFCLYLVEPSHLPDKDGYEVVGTGMKVFHVNGGLFRLTPTINFQTMKMNCELKIPLAIAAWSVARTDNMPRWYVANSDGSVAFDIEFTNTEYLDKFTGEYTSYVQWKRYEQDEYDPWNATDRYQRWSSGVKADGQGAKIVIPTPLNTGPSDGILLAIPLTNWSIIYSAETEKAKNSLLAAYPYWGWETEVGNCITDISKVICLNLSPNFNGTLYDAYKLDIQAYKYQIHVESKSTAGVYYGVQTLISLIDGVLANNNFGLAGRRIEDGARYEYRGMHVDNARNYIEPDKINTLIEMMGKYKLNKLHLHLTDDEAWRLQMPWCWELTTVGSRRCHDLNEEKCIIPQLGSGADGQHQYLTKELYQEILIKANENYIQVIPEIDMPGHMHAAIKATEEHARKNDNDTYLLSNADDTSEYLSVQQFTDNAIAPCISSTYTFIEATVRTLVEYHEGIQPLEVMHLGGDEVVESAWMESPQCKATLGEGYTHNDVKKYFMTRISQLVKKISPSLTLGLWEDGVMNGTTPFDRSDFVNDKVMTFNWQSIWEWGYGNRPYILANAGYQVVMSQATHLYFDHPYEPDPEERGLYWATRYTDTRKTFGFKPDDLYANVETKRSGEPYTEEQMCKDFNCVELKETQNIVGMQGQLFSETVRTSEQFDYMIYPRILALAERAWHKAEWENTSDTSAMKDDFARFANAVGEKELKRMEWKGVYYRIPVPGVTINEYFQVVANSEFPGMKIMYSMGETNEWKTYTGPLIFGDFESIRFRCVSSDETRFGRTTFITRASGSSGIRPSFYVVFTVIASLLKFCW